MHFLSEIAQHQLSDLGRGVHAKRTLSVLDTRSPSLAAGEDTLKVICSAERVVPLSTVSKTNVTSIDSIQPVLVLFSKAGLP